MRRHYATDSFHSDMLTQDCSRKSRIKIPPPNIPAPHTQLVQLHLLPPFPRHISVKFTMCQAITVLGECIRLLLVSIWVGVLYGGMISHHWGRRLVVPLAPQIFLLFSKNEPIQFMAVVPVVLYSIDRASLETNILRGAVFLLTAAFIISQPVVSFKGRLGSVPYSCKFGPSCF